MASPNSVASTFRRDAGICCPAPWDKISGTDFQDTIDTNVVGTWNTVMAGAHHIIDGGRGGSIILIGSAAGVKMQAFMVHYTASKHAITGLARAFAAELGRHRIRVNALHPGAVATAMGTGRMREALRTLRILPTPTRYAQASAPRGYRPTRGHRRRRGLACLR